MRDLIRANSAPEKPSAVAAATGESAPENPGADPQTVGQNREQAVTEPEKVNVYDELRAKLAEDPNFQDPQQIEAERAQRFQAYIDTVHAEEAKALH